jgi:hypothetical protein
MSTTPTDFKPPHDHSGLRVGLVAGGSFVVVLAIVALFVQMNHVRTDMEKTHESIMAEIANLRDASSANMTLQARRLEALKEELESTRALGTVRADRLAKQAEAGRARTQQQLSREIRDVKEASDAANASLTSKIGDVSTDVGGVKTELQKATAQLKSVQGDLGVQSGLIATNATELGALKRLGERNYFEFRVGKTKEPQRVADITLLLKKTDPKRNRYTVEVMADDKLTEKKDKNINEPVQFYTTKAKQPYELVVNTVRKDLIIGYLATPKVQSTR